MTTKEISKETRKREIDETVITVEYTCDKCGKVETKNWIAKLVNDYMIPANWLKIFIKNEKYLYCDVCLDERRDVFLSESYKKMDDFADKVLSNFFQDDIEYGNTYYVPRELEDLTEVVEDIKRLVKEYDDIG